MKFGEFIKEKILLIFLVLFIIASSEILLLPYPQIVIFVRLYIAICPVIIIGIDIVLEYRKKSNFYNELKNNSEIIDIAKEYLEKAYKNMKENVTPKFSKELSQTISNISDGKYKNMKITDNDIMVEVENGNYVSASLLSEGTINQLYFSLRMAILKEISNETLPIFLDESFVFFDKNRLINTINYLNSNHDNQIIIFSCTEREKDILDYLNIKYNLITL